MSNVSVILFAAAAVAAVATLFQTLGLSRRLRIERAQREENVAREAEHMLEEAESAYQVRILKQQIRRVRATSGAATAPADGSPAPDA